MTLREWLGKKAYEHSVAHDAEERAETVEAALDAIRSWFAQELDGVIDPDDRAVALHKARVEMLGR